MAHHCHAAGCLVPTRPEMFMCSRHWFMLPEPMRDAIWATYRPGQCDDKQISHGYAVAARAAVRHLASLENINPDLRVYDMLNPETPAGRQPAGRGQGAAGLPYRLPGPCLPAAVSYDPADEAAAPLHARFMVEEGTQPARGAAWVGHVVAWWAGPWGLGGGPEGWRRVVPCQAFVSCQGELLRFFGWDAITDFAGIVMGTSPPDVATGLDVHVRTGESPGGEHWWWIIDRLGADGEIPSEGIPDGPVRSAREHGGPAGAG